MSRPAHAKKNPRSPKSLPPLSLPLRQFGETSMPLRFRMPAEAAFSRLLVCETHGHACLPSINNREKLALFVEALMVDTASHEVIQTVFDLSPAKQA